MATITGTDITSSIITNNSQPPSSCYKYISTATADQFITSVEGVSRIALQADGLSADTLAVYATIEVSTAPDSWVQILDDAGANPFAAPAGDCLFELSTVSFSQIKVVRTGAVDTTINIFLSKNI
jgi:hypothetical protein